MDPGFLERGNICIRCWVYFADFISFFLNIPWKWNNLVSLRPNYIIFIGYLKTGGSCGGSSKASQPPLDPPLQDGHHGGSNRTILAVLTLHVVLLPHKKFQFEPSYRFGELNMWKAKTERQTNRWATGEQIIPESPWGLSSMIRAFPYSPVYFCCIFFLIFMGGGGCKILNKT